MDERAYIQILEDLEEMTRILQRRLKAFEKATAHIREQLDAGGCLDDAMTPSLWAMRDLVDEGWLDFQHALRRARSQGVALVVDHGGLTLTAFARKRGVSRQLISKLYNEAHPRQR